MYHWWKFHVSSIADPEILSQILSTPVNAIINQFVFNEDLGVNMQLSDILRKICDEVFLWQCYPSEYCLLLKVKNNQMLK